jgi:hypothetical protein
MENSGLLAEKKSGLLVEFKPTAAYFLLGKVGFGLIIIVTILV